MKPPSLKGPEPVQMNTIDMSTNRGELNSRLSSPMSMKAGDISWVKVDGKLQKVRCIGVWSGDLTIPNFAEKMSKASNTQERSMITNGGEWHFHPLPLVFRRHFLDFLYTKLQQKVYCMKMLQLLSTYIYGKPIISNSAGRTRPDCVLDPQCPGSGVKAPTASPDSASETAETRGMIWR